MVVGFFLIFGSWVCFIDYSRIFNKHLTVIQLTFNCITLIQIQHKNFMVNTSISSLTLFAPFCHTFYCYIFYKPDNIFALKKSTIFGRNLNMGKCVLYSSYFYHFECFLFLCVEISFHLASFSYIWRNSSYIFVSWKSAGNILPKLLLVWKYFYFEFNFEGYFHWVKNSRFTGLAGFFFF